MSANRSRGVLKSQSDRRGVVISELQRELVDLEADPTDESRAKARLHALNAKLGTVIRELEETGASVAPGGVGDSPHVPDYTQTASTTGRLHLTTPALIPLCTIRTS